MSSFANFSEIASKENNLNEVTKNTDISKIDLSEVDKPFICDKNDTQKKSSDAGSEEGTATNGNEAESAEGTTDKGKNTGTVDGTTENGKDAGTVEGTATNGNDARSTEGTTTDDTNTENDKPGLTQEDKQRIKEETGWSDEIIDAIGSMKEYELYKKAGLQEAEIAGKKCLIRTDIDMEQKDGMGRTNKERMEQGLAPLTKDGKPIELHHIGQHPDSPLAELTMDEHRGKGNDTILHDKTKESEIDRNQFNGEKENHWKERAEGSNDNE